MATPFLLEVNTPRRQFFRGEVESVSFFNEEGMLCVMAGHAPMIAAISTGSLSIRVNGELREAFCGDGFLEVRPTDIVIFAESCRWPEEADERQLAEDRRRMEEKLRRAHSAQERAMVARALARLQRARSSTPNEL